MPSSLLHYHEAKYARKYPGREVATSQTIFVRGREDHAAAIIYQSISRLAIQLASFGIVYPQLRRLLAAS